MRPTSLAAALALPFLVLAQQQGSQNSSQPQPSQTVITSASLSTFISLGPDRQLSAGTSTFLFTTTQILTPAPQPSGNGTVGNGTVSGNSTVSANSTSSTPRNLPTAPTNVNGGGAVAPSPGQSGGGIFGPDDNYIAAATALKRNAFVVGFVGFALGGAMLIL